MFLFKIIVSICKKCALVFFNRLLWLRLWLWLCLLQKYVQTIHLCIS